jgi:hypothetical protein
MPLLWVVLDAKDQVLTFLFPVVLVELVWIPVAQPYPAFFSGVPSYVCKHSRAIKTFISLGSYQSRRE